MPPTAWSITTRCSQHWLVLTIAGAAAMLGPQQCWGRSNRLFKSLQACSTFTSAVILSQLDSSLAHKNICLASANKLEDMSSHSTTGQSPYHTRPRQCWGRDSLAGADNWTTARLLDAKPTSARFVPNNSQYFSGHHLVCTSCDCQSRGHLLIVENCPGKV